MAIQTETITPAIVNLISKNDQFTIDRPLLAYINRGTKLRSLLVREIQELLEAMSDRNDGHMHSLAKIIEEIPDVLIFIIQYWRTAERTHEEIVSMLSNARDKVPALSEDAFQQHLVEFQMLHFILQANEPLSDEQLQSALTLCFSLSAILGFDLYELADVKSNHNDDRYQKELYQLEDLDTLAYWVILQIYQERREMTRKFASENLPKAVHLYPKLLELRKARE